MFFLDDTIWEKDGGRKDAFLGFYIYLFYLYLLDRLTYKDL